MDAFFARVIEIGEALENGMTSKEVADKYDLSISRVRDLKREYDRYKYCIDTNPEQLKLEMFLEHDSRSIKILYKYNVRSIHDLKKLQKKDPTLGILYDMRGVGNRIVEHIRRCLMKEGDGSDR